MPIAATKRSLLALSMILVTSGCTNSALTLHENMELQMIRGYSLTDKGPPSINLRIINENPVGLAKNAAQQGNYHLLGIVGRFYKPPVSPTGVTCTGSVDVDPVVTGCMISPVFEKLVQQYNTTMIQQNGFPAKEKCQVDTSFTDAMNKFEADSDKSAQQDSEKAIKTWQQRNQMSKLYNE